jgi:hypothetical protein
VVFKGDYMVFSDVAGFDNYARTSTKSSPLAAMVPQAYVPVAASVVAMTFLWLWNLLINLIRKSAESFAKGKVTGRIMKSCKKKTVTEPFKGIKFHGIRFKYEEWGSIILAAFVFAAAISYTYYIKAEALPLIILSFSVNLILYTLQNLMRIVLDKHHTTHTQYHIWWYGVFLTLFSGLLGNTFGLAGYVSSAEGHEKEKTKIQFKVILATLVFGLIFLMVNLLSPGKVFQMVMLSTITSSFLQLIPVTPYSGRDLLKHNKVKWALLFFPSLICYLIVMMLY